MKKNQEKTAASLSNVFAIAILVIIVLTIGYIFGSTRRPEPTQKEKDALALYETVESICSREKSTLEFKTAILSNGNIGFYITCVAK